jgi:hypothetical protein
VLASGRRCTTRPYQGNALVCDTQELPYDPLGFLPRPPGREKRGLTARCDHHSVWLLFERYVRNKILKARTSL